MRAHVGDRIIVEGRKVGQPRRQGEVVEIIESPTTYYRVRWQDGQETVFFPSSDARIEPAAHTRSND